MQLNREQAKLILSCHPWEEEQKVADADYEAAIAMLDTDPELASWFEAEREWDHSIAAQLQSAPVPEGLKEDLSQAYERGINERVARAKKRTLLTGFLIAGALSLLVVGFFLKPYLIEGDGHSTAIAETAEKEGTYKPSPQTYTAFREEIAGFVADRFALSKFASDYTEMEKWVISHGGSHIGSLHQGILEAPGIGCNVVTWSGGTCSLICFKNDKGSPIHLFVTPRQTVTELPTIAELQVSTKARDLETAAWIDDDNVYLLCAPKAGIEVTPFLKDLSLATRFTYPQFLASYL